MMVNVILFFYVVVNLNSNNCYCGIVIIFNKRFKFVVVLFGVIKYFNFKVCFYGFWFFT